MTLGPQSQAHVKVARVPQEEMTAALYWKVMSPYCSTQTLAIYSSMLALFKFVTHKSPRITP